MLWQRVLTALLLVPLVVGGILFLDSAWFAGVLGAVILLGGYEMARLANLDQAAGLASYALALSVAMWLLWQHLPAAVLYPVQTIMTAWWVLATLLLVTRRRALLRVAGRRPAILLLGALVLLMAWLSLARLHASGPHGPHLVLFVFVLIWVADSGAYFAGRAFGQRKLSPFVSPGKTWAGVGGALLGAAASGLLLYSTSFVPVPSLTALVALCLLVTAVSIGGDLWESRLKREAGVKDSGAILPGHGGMLDRIDSLLAAAPVFAAGAVTLGLVP